MPTTALPAQLVYSRMNFGRAFHSGQRAASYKPAVCRRGRLAIVRDGKVCLSEPQFGCRESLVPSGPGISSRISQAFFLSARRLHLVPVPPQLSRPGEAGRTHRPVRGSRWPRPSTTPRGLTPGAMGALVACQRHGRVATNESWCRLAKLPGGTGLVLPSCRAALGGVDEASRGVDVSSTQELAELGTGAMPASQARPRPVALHAVAIGCQRQPSRLGPLAIDGGCDWGSRGWVARSSSVHPS